MHVVIVLLAFFLFGLSALTYKRERRPALVYVAIAFGLFAVQQSITLLEVTVFHSENIVIFTHFLAGIILLLFFLGVVRKK
jgi:hypothetical protein